MRGDAGAGAGNTAIAVRPETAADLTAVAALQREAFGDWGERVIALVEDLRRLLPQGGAALVAEVGGTVVGPVMVTPALLDTPRQLVSVGVLSPLGVRPAWQRQGIGRALVQAAVRAAAATWPLLFLEGDPAYYGPLGFAAAGPQGMRRPSLRSRTPPFRSRSCPGMRPG